MMESEMSQHRNCLKNYVFQYWTGIQAKGEDGIQLIVATCCHCAAFDRSTRQTSFGAGYYTGNWQATMT